LKDVFKITVLAFVPSNVEKAMGKLLGKTLPEFKKFELILLNKGQKTVYNESQSKNALNLRLTLTVHEEHFYAARSSSSKAEEIGIPCFLYDGLCQINEQFGFIFHTVDEFVTELVDSL